MARAYRHEQTDVQRPAGEHAVNAAVEQVHHRLRADQRDDALGVGHVGERERAEAGALGGGEDRGPVGDGGREVVLADLGADQADGGAPAVARAQLVESLQEGLEVDVAPGDPEREHEGDPVLQGRPHVRLDVGRLVRRHLLARPQPVRAPVAAGALGDDDIDAPLQRLGDLLLDVGRRRDVVDETQDAHLLAHVRLLSRALTAPSRRTRRSTLPAALRGSSSRKRIVRGRL